MEAGAVKFLVHHPAGPEVEVPRPGTTHWSTVQPNRGARGADQGMRSLLSKAIPDRLVGSDDGIGIHIFQVPKTVEDHQYNRPRVVTHDVQPLFHLLRKSGENYADPANPTTPRQKNRRSMQGRTSQIQQDMRIIVL